MLSTAVANEDNSDSSNNNLLEEGGQMMSMMGQQGQGQGQQLSEQEQEAAAMVQEQIAVVCQEIAPMLPRLSTVLASLLPNHDDNNEENEGEETTTKKRLRFQTQSLKPVPRLGHLGLQLVKVTEALLRLGNPLIDAACLSSGLLPLCLRLFLAFEFNSVLHLSVQRILVAVLEPQPITSNANNASSISVRSALQVHLLSDAGLLQVLMDRVGGLNQSSSLDQQQPKDQNDENDVNDATLVLPRRPAWLKPVTALTAVNGFVFVARHSSVVGHLIPVAHAVYLLLSGKEDDEDGNNATAAAENSQQTLVDPSSPVSAVTSPLYSRLVSDGSSGSEGTEGSGGEGEDSLTVVGDHHQDVNTNLNDVMVEDQPAAITVIAAAAVPVVILNDLQARAMQLREAIGDAVLLAAWDGFVETRFKAVLEQQSIPPLQESGDGGGQGQQTGGGGVGLQGLARPDDMDLPPDIDDDVFGGYGGGSVGGRSERHHSNPPWPEPRVMRGDFDEDDDDDDDEIDGDHIPRYHQHHLSHAQHQQQQQAMMESDDSDDWGDSNNTSGNSHDDDNSSGGGGGGGGDWADFSGLDASLPSPPDASGLNATGLFEPGQLGGNQSAMEPVVFEAFADFAAFDEIMPPLPPPSAAQEEAKDTALFE
jgi:hypothetical protein